MKMLLLSLILLTSLGVYAEKSEVKSKIQLKKDDKEAFVAGCVYGSLATARAFTRSHNPNVNVPKVIELCGNDYDLLFKDSEVI